MELVREEKITFRANPSRGDNDPPGQEGHCQASTGTGKIGAAERRPPPHLKKACFASGEKTSTFLRLAPPSEEADGERPRHSGGGVKGSRRPTRVC